MKWFRFYSEFRHDTKLKRMPIAHRYAFVVLLCLASDQEQRGIISKLDDEDIAFELEMEHDDWQTLRAKFKVKGLIDFTSKGEIIITNWDKRQFSSDTSNERVSKHREKNKKQACNVTVTEVKRHVTPSETYTDPDPDPEPERSPERAESKKSADPESLISKTPEAVSQPLEEKQISSPLAVNPNPVDGEKGSAACSIPTDKTKTIFGKTRSSVAQKQRAEEANWLSAGVANKRWKDRPDLDRFVGYAEIYTENRRQDTELNPDGTMYGKGYVKTIIERTATSQDENDPYLTCWKTWNLEPSAPNYIELRPEMVAVVDDAAEAEFQITYANFQAEDLARKAVAAAEKVKKGEILRGLYES